MRTRHLILIFILFGMSLLGVKGLDHYTSRYENCADIWIEAVEEAVRQPYQQEYMLRQIDMPGAFMIDERPCPPLWPEHKNILKQRLMQAG